MKQLVRVIKTQRDYDEALARLSALMDEEFTPGSKKEDELELLALVIESYERSKVAPARPDSIEAILFRMDQILLGSPLTVLLTDELRKSSNSQLWQPVSDLSFLFRATDRQ